MTATPEQLAELLRAATALSTAADTLTAADAVADEAQERVTQAAAASIAAEESYGNAKVGLSAAKADLDAAVAAIVG